MTDGYVNKDFIKLNWHGRFSPLEEEGRMWSNLPDVSGFCMKYGQM